MFFRGLVLKSVGLAQSSVPRLFSTSSIAFSQKSQRYLKAALRREANILKQYKLREGENKLDPVLGRANNSLVSRLNAEVAEPNMLTKGYKLPEVERLLYGAQEASIKESFASDSIRANAIKQREAVMRILTLRNRSSSEALKIKTEMARKEFQRFDGDTGSSEVQAAIATVRIHQIYHHVTENKKDNKNTRYLRMLVQKRQRMLRYLKRDDPEKYYWTINKLGLNDTVVHQEFNMDKHYMQKFKMFGDRVLVKLSENQKEKIRKHRRLEKKAAKMKSIQKKKALQKKKTFQKKKSKN